MLTNTAVKTIDSKIARFTAHHTASEAGNADIAPIVKWVGGKRQLLSALRLRLPQKIDEYVEPFFGGGALCFAIMPTTLWINDTNTELMNLYTVVKEALPALLENLKHHQNNEAYYYKLRALDRARDSWQKMSAVQQASRLLYLNKTCYNGLYRVNRAGEFNAPFGHYISPTIVDEKRLVAVGRYFNEVDVSMSSVDFKTVASNVSRHNFGPNAFFFFDPPYYPMTDIASFTGYTAQGFNFDAHVQLKKWCDNLTANKIKFLQCNSAHRGILSLYQDYFIEEVSALRNINCQSHKRGPVSEVFIRNYACEGDSQC